MSIHADGPGLRLGDALPVSWITAIAMPNFRSVSDPWLSQYGRRAAVRQWNLVVLAVNDTPLRLHDHALSSMRVAAHGPVCCIVGAQLIVRGVLVRLIGVSKKARPRSLGTEGRGVERLKERFEAGEGGEHDVASDDHLPDDFGGKGVVHVSG